MPYFVLVAALAEDAGIALATWSPVCQRALWSCRTLFSRENAGDNKLAIRKQIEAQLGEKVLERHLPSVVELPFPEILALRDRRAPELEAFRVAVSELATQVDVTNPLNDQQLQINDLVAAKVDPAVQELKASLASTKLDIVNKIGKSWTAIVGTTVPAVLAFTAGAPLEVSAALGALGAVGLPIAETIAQQQKLRHASQWSFLLAEDEIDV